MACANQNFFSALENCFMDSKNVHGTSAFCVVLDEALGI